MAELEAALAKIATHDGAAYIEVMIPETESQPLPEAIIDNAYKLKTPTARRLSDWPSSKWGRDLARIASMKRRNVAASSQSMRGSAAPGERILIAPVAGSWSTERAAVKYSRKGRAVIRPRASARSPFRTSNVGEGPR